jgi:hypothetical protein
MLATAEISARSLLPEKLPRVVLQVTQHLLQIVVERFVHH